jgi:hypothetical protein
MLSKKAQWRWGFARGAPTDCAFRHRIFRADRRGRFYLPQILPQSDSLHTALWNAHFYLAFVFFALILMHVAARSSMGSSGGDGVFDTMGPALTRDEVAPAE